MRSSFLAVALLLVAGLMADLAQGHGGTYTGPQGGGTPTYGGPAGGATGGTGGGATGGGGPSGGATGGGGPGGGSTPPSGGGPARPGAGGRAGGGGLRGGATTPGKSKAKDDDKLNDWDFWWELNDDQYLKLKATIRSKEAGTSNQDSLLGESDGNVVAKPTSTEIRTKVRPSVMIGLKDSFFDARAGAVIALGKVADAKDIEAIDAIKKLLSDSDKQVRESACLGLGMLGSKESVPLLLSILKNEPSARQLCGYGTKDIYTRQRAFAAAAIGLIGSREALDQTVVTELIAQMNAQAADKDIKVFPALALGIMRSQSAVVEIKKLVQDLEGDEIVRAHAVVALGKLGHKDIVPWLVKDGLTDKSNHVQRSSAIALGLLTDREDEKSVEELVKYSKSAADRGVRNFCLIALGQIGNTKGRDHLVATLKKGQQHDRTFSALALGVYGYKFKESRAEIGKEVLDVWNQTRNDSEKGAYAISMGLLDYKLGAPALIEELKTGGSPNLKGYVALGLGLMGEKSAMPLMQDLAKKVSDLDVQRRASISLGLIQDPAAVEILTKVIEGAAENLSALGGAAVALGFIGDRKAVPVLTQMLEKKDQFKDNARAFAAVALGILGDKDELPLLSKIQSDSNYIASTEALAEILLIY